MSTRILKLFFGVVFVNFCSTLLYGEPSFKGPHLEPVAAILVDTIPLKERFGNFVTDKTTNPFDIQTSIIDQEVEFDPESGKYIITEKIGDEYYRMPTYMDFEEYLEWRAKKQEKDYFDKLAGVETSRRSGNGEVDPMKKVNINQNMSDRLFGGNAVTIEPNGSIDMTFGVDYQNVQNPFIAPRLQRQGGFDFDMDIQMALDGKIGDKMDIGFNYNTQATFDFDNKIKLAYDSEQFTEDDIIKTIEAGDVSLPLRSQLIQGNQSLFGIKSEWQFGKMRVTGIASQQRSEQKDLVIENGALIREFEVRPDDYDENRHFFVSHYARDNYERALENMPQIKSLYRITNMEVWVTNDQNSDLRNSASVAAIQDLGESNLERFGNPQTIFPPRSPLPADLVDITGQPLPDNATSDLFLDLVNDDETRKIVNTSTRLKTVYGMTQTRDFEVQTMRKLNPNEFTYNPNLGFLSINVRLRPNQVLGVAYEYTYSLNGNKVYKVGELTNESNRGGLDELGDPEPEDVVYVKMLKSSNQRVDLPSWDLMMKNVYPLGTAQLTEEDFQLDIFYEDFNDATLKRFLPETTPERDFRTIPLLEVFQLDKLNRQGDPQQDGVFDFVPNLTINTRTGSIFFPVLEPFGNSLLQLLDNNTELFEKYGFPKLYTETITDARENLDANRFVMKGKYKSSISSEISLGGFNIPQGSVVVRAGSQILREGIDYDIDYGIGRLKIINDAYLQQGVPIRVSFEDQSLFSLQQKTMLGLRFDYEASKNLNLGATYMRLFERPFTEKVNLGDDPINNRIFGLDLTYSNELPFLTRMVDKLPFYSTKEASAINFTAEVAALKPGHSKAINVSGGTGGGVVSLDDFEGAGSSIPLGSRPNLWILASTPETDDDRFPEAELANNTIYGANRALLNWYVIDNRGARNAEDRRDSYSRNINQNELFRRQLPPGVIPDLLTFDLTYCPTERGPYNFDPPEGTPFSAGLELDPTTRSLKLKEPESRWGGIMRYLPNNDFQASNFQYIEFWMLNPFISNERVQHEANEVGKIYFNLGNVSEDVLKDNLQFYENSLPSLEENIPLQETEWGQVPLSIPQVNGFDQENITIQDLGLDGLSDAAESDNYAEYINDVLSTAELAPAAASLLADPANDNFISYLDEGFSEDVGIIDRYSRYNHPQGNAPDANSRIGTGNPIPDAEDLNDNRSLEQSESYYEYEITIENDGGEIARQPEGDFITDIREITNPNTGDREKWYRYRIPIPQGKAVNGIQGFRSIQFIRMYMEGFSTKKTFRLAEFELARNQWRQLPIDSTCFGDGDINQIEFVIDEIGIEENSNKQPFRYVTPRGIKQERLFNTFSNVLQDEKSLKMNICGLPDSCDAMIYRLTEPDLRLFENLQMFVHAESIDPLVEDGDMAIFIRIGKDFNNNFYEYEIPLTLSDFETAENAPGTEAYADEVWKRENYVNVALKAFTELKKARNLSGQPLTDEFVRSISEFLPEDLAQDTTLNRNANLKIKGNPSLGYVKGLIVGLRNKKGGVASLCGEVWINELRMAGIKEDGGVAGLARLELQLADLGDVTASARYSSVGWGAIDQRVAERSLERNLEYDVATNLELSKFTPHNWNLSIPFYAQYSRQQVKPKFDPYELDLTVNEVLESTTDPDERIDVIDRSTQQTTIKTYALTNVKKNRSQDAKGSAKPWSVSNFSASYSYTQTEYKDEIIKFDKSDDYRGSLDYDYSRRPNYIQPFKGNKLKLLKEFNFNPFPNSFSFTSQIRRFKSEKLYRIPDPTEIEYLFNDSRFDWDRRYNLQWDFTKALNLSFSANNYGVIDELRQVGVRKSAADRDWVNERGDLVGDVTETRRKDYIRENIRDFGRNKNYDHRIVLNYTLPIRYLPYMDWISMKAQYSADYAWTRASINADSLGNVIQNNQSRSFNATFNFDKLYNKSKYLKSLDQRAPRRTSRRNEGEAEDEKKTNTRQSRSSNKARVPSGAEKFFVRPLLSLRSMKFTYKENLGTVVPGFLPSTTYLGQASGFNTPGWGFVAGLQPDININNPNNWLINASENNWISTSIFQNQQVIQNNTQNYEARVELEPWRDFKINVNFRKQFTENHSEDFINTTGNPNDPLFRQLALRDIGSFEVTYFAMNTLFNNDIRSLFNEFSDSRTIISARHDNQDFEFPEITTHEKDGFEYARGYGRQHTNVLIPAFISAYTGLDPNTVELDLHQQIGSRAYIPKPNWDLRYNGLSKIPMFRDIFNNVNITHGYKSTLRVSSFSTDLQYQAENPFFIDPLINTRNYFARFEIPELIITEQFSPIIGIEVKTKSNMNLNFEWKKTRDLRLSVGLGQLTETRATELVFGLGFTKSDVNIGFLTGGNNKNRRGRQTEEPEEPTSNRGGVTNSRGRELTFNLDFAMRDDVTWIHKFDDGATEEPIRGLNSIRFSPSVDYDVNQNLTLRMFFDYNASRPYVSNSYPITSIQGGITASFILN